MVFRCALFEWYFIKALISLDSIYGQLFPIGINSGMILMAHTFFFCTHWIYMVLLCRNPGFLLVVLSLETMELVLLFLRVGEF